MVETERLKEQLKRLSLHAICDSFQEEAKRAAQTKLSYTGYLSRLIEEETLAKLERSINARVAKAKFPAMKTLESFDFSFQPSIEEGLIRELAELSFIEKAENILFLGPPGVGKTHLAIALGLKACQARKRVLFAQAVTLADELLASVVDRSIGSKLGTLGRLDLLIIDELGYMPMEKQRANLFFQLVSRCYERGAIILTSNKSFDQWGEVFGDEVIASAILDRLLHHSYIIPINGPSYRTREKSKHLDLDQTEKKCYSQITDGGVNFTGENRVNFK